MAAMTRHGAASESRNEETRMNTTTSNRFRRADGLCTVYALACGHLNAHTVGDDPQAVTMGADGAVYWVKSRVQGQPRWLTFPRDRDGYRDALRMFRKLCRAASEN